MDEINEKIVTDLYEKGWAVADGYVEDSFRKQLLEEQQDILAHGQFRHAGIGKGNSFAIKPEIRGDKVFWMDGNFLSPLQEVYWKRINDLSKKINQKCFLGLKSFEAHFAMYPPGSYYRRHFDQFQSVKYRVVSVILYLNEKWSSEDGGALKIYYPGNNGLEESKEIYPEGGRLVVFLSAEIPHEVLPTYKERISITGWLRDVE